MRSSEIRSLFLDFFRRKGHLVLPSFSLIPKDDPTLLLIGAGMAPLKPYFTGESKPPHPRVATCQKCVRTPDIERVGYTGRHAIFFEMLGNFSFGDYFKEEAITWAWELVREGFRMPRKKLWISVYEGPELSHLAGKIGVPDERIVRWARRAISGRSVPVPAAPVRDLLRPGAGNGCSGGLCSGLRLRPLPGDLEPGLLNFTARSRRAHLETKNRHGSRAERLAMALQGAASYARSIGPPPL